MSNRAELLEIESIIAAYAMSRLDREFLRHFSLSSWRAAYALFGDRLAVRPTSLKNLRDEFDPIHPNARRGWQRELRQNRHAVLAQFCETSDEGLLEIVRRILDGDPEVRAVVAEPILQACGRIDNVAERLRTGRLAEEYFLEHCDAVCGVQRGDLVDCRLDACGFDFAVTRRPRVAIEVKGLKARRGNILFTDTEWRQAKRRQADYWLVVVGSLEAKPFGRLITNPVAHVEVSCSIRTTTALAWHARVSV